MCRSASRTCCHLVNPRSTRWWPNTSGARSSTPPASRCTYSVEPEPTPTTSWRPASRGWRVAYERRSRWMPAAISFPLQRESSSRSISQPTMRREDDKFWREERKEYFSLFNCLALANFQIFEGSPIEIRFWLFVHLELSDSFRLQHLFLENL